MNIAVLITCHNREEKTLNCLTQIFSQLYDKNKFSVTVYLTDDGCTDNTVPEVKKRFPQVHIITGDGTLFWNRGMYVAWKAAEKYDYDFYLWLNDDTFINNDTFSSLLNTYYETGESCIIVGATCSSTDPLKITYGGWIKRTLLQDVSTVNFCETFNGNIVLISRNIYKKLGTNDPIFHHGQGDSDYGLRATKAGIKIAVCKGVLGVCDTHAKLPKWCDKHVPLKERWVAYKKPNGASPCDWFVFNRRHYGFLKAILILFTSFLHMVFPFIWHNKQSFYSEDLR